MPLCKYRAGDGIAQFGWVDRESETIAPVEFTLADLLRLDPAERARTTTGLPRQGAGGLPLRDAELLAPVDRQEIWAAGVTYARSREARMEESTQQDVYDRVYHAIRPEVFFKAHAEQCVGPGGSVAFRHDSEWNVPEPELAIVIDAAGRIAGYTIGNDMSSRSIEGENPLYLPQAKVYTDSCALGPWIVFPHELADPLDLDIRLAIYRGGTAQSLWSGEASTSQLHRTLEELAECMYAALDFPNGSVLLTGTCIVPAAEFTLADGDVVTIEIERIGTLENRVRVLQPRS
jgi:2-dehydro-3-deoxy-D-arabinonate dehydratase